MKSLTIDDNTSIQNLSTLFNAAGNADRIRAKIQNGTTVLYIYKPNLLSRLKEKFSSTYRNRLNTNRLLAKQAIQNILKKTDRGGRLEKALENITKHINKKNHDICAGKIRAEINDLDTSKGKLKIGRDQIDCAWHASLDELIFTQDKSQSEGVNQLIEISRMEEEDKDILKVLIQAASPKYLPEEITKDFDCLTQFFSVQGSETLVSEMDYSRISRFAHEAHQAISHLNKNDPLDNKCLSAFDQEPLKTAKLFFSAINNPRVTPLKIELSDPKETTRGQYWEEAIEEYMRETPSRSKAGALEKIATENLKDRQNFPKETIKIFLPEGVSKNEMQTAFLEAQRILRNTG